MSVPPRLRELVVRAEAAADRGAVRAVHEAAFETALEAELVDALREAARPLVSLVAEEGGVVVGHILFTPVELVGRGELRLFGLAPMAVLPERQRRGVGSELVRAGLAACRRAGGGAVVVVGHPAYYPRFGFSPAAAAGLRCEFEVPDEAFLVRELEPGSLDGAGGLIRYHEAFNAA